MASRSVGVVVAVVLAAAMAFLLLARGGGVSVEEPYARTTGFAAGVFMKIVNSGDSRVCLVKAEALENVNVKVELHKSERVGNTHVMRPVDRICAEPGSTVELRPGGYHVMIMGQPEEIQKVTADGVIKLRLFFEWADGRSESLVVEAPVKG